MTLFLFIALLALVLVELIKGLSANGTPPLLQKFSWQMDLAYFMWTNISWMRAVLVAAILILFWFAFPGKPVLSIVMLVLMGSLWAGIYWVFNHYWVGRVKFQPISVKNFVGERDNEVDPNVQVIGIDLNGEQKAFPVSMLFYHHQITDEVGGNPVWVTYCGLCRSGRVYDLKTDAEPMTFMLVGAITFNAVFKDLQSGSWWRQETGEAAKGPREGESLADIEFEQMSLSNWLKKYPKSQVLQYDPKFAPKYKFLTKLLAYEASLPGWHRQETPPLILGLEIKDSSRAYDWEQLKKRRLVNDELGGTPILVLSDEEGTSGFAFDRSLEGETLDFALENGQLVDTQTQSTWDEFGLCLSGKYEGKRLTRIQSYQQFLRAWISFHEGTSFYEF